MASPTKDAAQEEAGGRLAPRLERLPVIRVSGRAVRLADRRSARALGLAFLERRSAGGGLLIPRCRSVHTFGVRFPLDVEFLDAEGSVLSRRVAVRRRRIVADLRASAVLELPAEEAPR